MADQAQGTIHIKYVRSGIGFDYHTKVMIRSLGLRRLNDVVERQDTPQIRGLVAKIPHFVEVVEHRPAPAWLSTPEYTIHPPEPKPVSEAAEAGAAAFDEVLPEAVGPTGEPLEGTEAAQQEETNKLAAKERAEAEAAHKREPRTHKAARHDAEPAKHAAHAAKGKAKTAKAEAPKRAAKAAKHAKPEKKRKK